MPGFVDVTGWTTEEVRRLGHADDEDPRDSNYSHRNLARRNPYGYNRQTYTKPASAKFAISDVWAAACAAQRINGEYLKEPQRVFDKDTGLTHDAKRRNRDVMMDFLLNPENLTVEDVERGEYCRQFLQGDLTFRSLKGTLTEFDAAVRKVLAVTDHFSSQFQKYELAIVACLPASVERTEARQNSDNRMQFAQGGLIGKVGDKITAGVEVIGAAYSKEYNIYWIRGITDQDQPVMFSNKEKLDVGTHLTIQGKVKAHRDNLTQLNYVKVL